jgi:hypothetical protein
MPSTNNTFDIDTDVTSYTIDELLQILELGSGSESPTLEDIQNKVQLMMRQYPSIAFFFAQVGERLESEYADADDVAEEEGVQDEDDEANVWLKNQYLQQDGAKEFKQYSSNIRRQEWA